MHADHKYIKSGLAEFMNFLSLLFLPITICVVDRQISGIPLRIRNVDLCLFTRDRIKRLIIPRACIFKRYTRKVCAAVKCFVIDLLYSTAYYNARDIYAFLECGAAYIRNAVRYRNGS